MSVAMIRDLYDYHHWANRRLFDVAAALGEAPCARDVGSHFSVPTLTRMFAHLYGADAVWLDRWTGAPASVPPYPQLGSMAEVRKAWDVLETSQRAFVDRLTDADLQRRVDYKNTQGQAFGAPLGVLLQHVANLDPRDTRRTLIRALEMARPERVDRPWRTHGVMPV
jgi:uncharacterized damage-inducible protein DinB